jgi:hypothetical protein
MALVNCEYERICSISRSSIGISTRVQEHFDDRVVTVEDGQHEGSELSFLALFKVCPILYKLTHTLLAPESRGRREPGRAMRSL